MADDGDRLSAEAAQEACQLPAFAARCQVITDMQFWLGRCKVLQQAFRRLPRPQQRTGEDTVQAHALSLECRCQRPTLSMARRCQRPIRVVFDAAFAQRLRLRMAYDIQVHENIPLPYASQARIFYNKKSLFNWHEGKEQAKFAFFELIRK